MMRAVDLAAEWAALTPVTTSDLTRYGCCPGVSAGLVRSGRAILDGRHWQPHEAGAPCWVIAIRGHGDGDLETDNPARDVREAPIIDLVALDPATPSRWALRVGSATVLGLIPPQEIRPVERVHVHAEPLSWLRAGGDGICLLTEAPREQRSALLSCRSGYIVDDATFGARLRTAVEAPIARAEILVARRAA